MTPRAQFPAGFEARPWWWQAAPPCDDMSGVLPEQVQIAIIGAGYTGMSAALTLARRGMQVAVLDAGVLGAGASTRNGGQIGSGNQKFTVAALVNRYGKHKALALIREGTAMLEFIAALIAREHIDCSFRRVGRFRGAVHPDHYENMARDLEDLKRLAGVQSFMVPRAEQYTEIGTEAYHGGSVLPDDAALHPALYHKGLTDLARNAGAEMLPHTRVLAVREEKHALLLHTSRGPLRARKVIVATNGYTELRGWRDRVVPVGTAIVATQPLPETLMRELMPRGRVYGSSARVFHYFRPCPESKRLLFGGRVGRWAPQDRRRAYAHLHRDMRRLFPQLQDVSLSHGWSGYIGYTTDTLPHLGQQGNVYYALGYCGTGVSRSTYFGHKIALRLLGDKDAATAFDDLPMGSFRFRFAAPLGVAALETLYRLRDRWGR